MLHDRRIPGTNIDHIAVTRTGIYIIDAKNYTGRVRLQTDGNLFTGRTQKLFVGSRNCTRLLPGIQKQVGVVRACLQNSTVQAPTTGMLCFVDAQWPMLTAAFTIDTIQVLWPNRAFRQFGRPGPLDEVDIEHTHRLLANSFPAA